LGRLDRSDVTGPNAYRGPALMGDSRISNLYTKYTICCHTKLSYWFNDSTYKTKNYSFKQTACCVCTCLINCFSLKWSQQNVSRRATNSMKKKGQIISYPFSFIKIISSEAGLFVCSAQKLLGARHKDRNRGPSLLRPHCINKIFIVTKALFSFYISVSSNTQWSNKFLSNGSKFTWNAETMVQKSRSTQQILTMPVTLAEVHCCRIPCNITALEFCSKSPPATATESSITHWISDTYVNSHLIRGPSPIIQSNPTHAEGYVSNYQLSGVLGHRLSCRLAADRPSDLGPQTICPSERRRLSGKVQIDTFRDAVGVTTRTYEKSVGNTRTSDIHISNMT
jgi:hypothetical protein